MTATERVDTYRKEYLASFAEPLESLDLDQYLDQYLDDVLVDGDDWDEEIV